MRKINHQHYLLFNFFLCLYFLLPLVAIANDHVNTYVKCTTISPDGTLYPGKIEIAGDVNCFSFSTKAKYVYVIETSDLGPGCDTVIHLYDTDGTTELASNDDGGTGVASRIEWTAGSSGIYYIMIEHYDSTGGTGAYNISIK